MRGFFFVFNFWRYFLMPRQPKTTGLQGFDDFWNLYPLRVSKGAAMKAWVKLNPNEALILTILEAIRLQMTHRKKIERLNGTLPKWKQEFLPALKHPATWIRSTCWLDEIPEEKKEVTKSKNCAECLNESQYLYPSMGHLVCIRCYELNRQRA
jgi:hypothetical protein